MFYAGYDELGDICNFKLKSMCWTDWWTALVLRISISVEDISTGRSRMRLLVLTVDCPLFQVSFFNATTRLDEELALSFPLGS